MISSHAQEPRNSTGRRCFAHPALQSLLGEALARRPFSDDPKTAAETNLPESVPKFSAIPAAAISFRLQPWQPRCQTALTDAKYIFALATQDLANELAAKACHTGNAFDGQALIGHLPHHLIGLLAAPKAFALQPFCCRQLGRIKRLRPDRLSNGRHAPLRSAT